MLPKCHSEWQINFNKKLVTCHLPMAIFQTKGAAYLRQPVSSLTETVIKHWKTWSVCIVPVLRWLMGSHSHSNRSHYRYGGNSWGPTLRGQEYGTWWSLSELWQVSKKAVTVEGLLILYVNFGLPDCELLDQIAYG